MKVYIAEDEGVTAVHVKRIIENLGHEVGDVLPTAEGLIEQTREVPPELVLMDISLAGNMDGIRATEAIKKDFDVPVVCVTAYGDPETRERVLQSGADGYLQKPIDPSDLGDLLDYFTGQTKEKPGLNGELFFNWLRRRIGTVLNGRGLVPNVS
jgi:CheY-like chemotaxis protein